MTRLLRWALFLLVAGVFAGMTAANWGEAPIDFVLPDGTVIMARLPILLIAAFLAGWLPPWLWLVGQRRLTRRPGATVSPPGAFAGPPPAGTFAGPPPAAAGTAGLCDQAQPTIVPPAA